MSYIELVGEARVPLPDVGIDRIRFTLSRSRAARLHGAPAAIGWLKRRKDLPAFA